jgi:hypothetical protein
LQIAVKSGILRIERAGGQESRGEIEKGKPREKPSKAEDREGWRLRGPLRSGTEESIDRQPKPSNANRRAGYESK